jgi:peptidoglycan-N-acetylglucosamine deacetylase
MQGRGRVIAGSIGLVVILQLSLLLAGSLAHGAAQSDVTDRSMVEHADGYDISLAYPEIGIVPADAAIRDFVQADFNAFKEWASHRLLREPRYFAELRYVVLRNDDSMVSIMFSYSFYTGGAHPNLTRSAFNFLIPDGSRVFLPDLVGSAGVKRVSDIAIGNLDAQLTGPNGMSDPNWIRTGAGPYADNFEAFEWLPDKLVLEFDPYQVAAYAAGPQEVDIPLAQLTDVLRPDPRSPLPSFECSEAQTAIEHAICSDMQLAQLDRRTAEAFNMRLRLEASGNQQPTVRAQQQAWLGQRDAACAGRADADLVSCLDPQYQLRLTALQSFN